MKQIIVNSCDDCPHLYGYKTYPQLVFCRKAEKMVHSSETIPEWCPLDDVKEPLEAACDNVPERLLKFFNWRV